jgi:hypothetical protein
MPIGTTGHAPVRHQRERKRYGPHAEAVSHLCEPKPRNVGLRRRRYVTEALKRARDHAAATLRWVAGFSSPDLNRGYGYVAMRHPDKYPITEGRIVSSRGRVRQQVRRAACRTFDRAAIGAEAARQLSDRAAGPRQPQCRPLACRVAGFGGGVRTGTGLSQPVSRHHRTLGRTGLCLR